MNWQQVWAAIGGGAALLGTLMAGYGIGIHELDQQVSAAKDLGISEGENRARREFENAQFRDETLAKLLSVVQSPAVKSVLPEETNKSIATASTAVENGDLKAAAMALPSGVLSIVPSECIPEGASATVELGTAISTCHIYGTRALIGEFVTATQSVAVSVNGESRELKSGSAFQPSKAATCAVLLEKIIDLNTRKGARVSFSCS